MLITAACPPRTSCWSPNKMAHQHRLCKAYLALHTEHSVWGAIMIWGRKHSGLSYGSGKVLVADWSRSHQLSSGLLVLRQLKKDGSPAWGNKRTTRQINHFITDLYNNHIAHHTTSKGHVRAAKLSLDQNLGQNLCCLWIRKSLI
jgi:hypothetical protein